MQSETTHAWGSRQRNLCLSNHVSPKEGFILNARLYVHFIIQS